MAEPVKDTRSVAQVQEPKPDYGIKADYPTLYEHPCEDDLGREIWSALRELLDARRFAYEQGERWMVRDA